MSSSKPLQVWPPCLGAGLEHDLVLIVIPRSHVLSHSDQSDHCVHPPSTGAGVVANDGKYKLTVGNLLTLFHPEKVLGAKYQPNFFQTHFLWGKRLSKFCEKYHFLIVSYKYIMFFVWKLQSSKSLTREHCTQCKHTLSKWYCLLLYIIYI